MCWGWGWIVHPPWVGWLASAGHRAGASVVRLFPCARRARPDAGRAGRLRRGLGLRLPGRMTAVASNVGNNDLWPGRARQFITTGWRSAIAPGRSRPLLICACAWSCSHGASPAPWPAGGARWSPRPADGAASPPPQVAGRRCALAALVWPGPCYHGRMGAAPCRRPIRAERARSR